MSAKAKLKCSEFRTLSIFLSKSFYMLTVNSSYYDPFKGSTDNGTKYKNKVYE